MQDFPCEFEQIVGKCNILPSIFYKCFRKRHCEMTNKRFAMRRGGEGGRSGTGGNNGRGAVTSKFKTVKFS